MIVKFWRPGERDAQYDIQGQRCLPIYYYSSFSFILVGFSFAVLEFCQMYFRIACHNVVTVKLLPMALRQDSRYAARSQVVHEPRKVVVLGDIT